MSRFHADLHIVSGAAADPVGGNGTMTGPGTLLFDPHEVGLVVRKLMISVDTAMRVVVGASDQDNQRIRAATLGANGGAAPDTCWEGAPGQRISIWHSAQGNIDVAIDGDLIDK